MRGLYRAGVIAAVVCSNAVYASEGESIQKVKTGILPTGGFFSIYEVACPQDTTASIASTDRRQRWCVEADGQLRCFGAVSEATQHACSGVLLADSSDKGVSATAR